MKSETSQSKVFHLLIREVFDCLAGLRKIKIRWDLLRSFDPMPLLTLEQELEGAVQEEYEARRMAHQSATKKEPKRRRRRGAAASEEPTPVV